MPGQLMIWILDLVGGGGLLGLGVVFLFEILLGALVMQHRPLPGQMADLSISSHSRLKKPVTQVPWHRASSGISSGSEDLDGFFFFFFSLSTSMVVEDSAVSITSPSSSSSSSSSVASSFFFLSESSELSFPSLHLLSSLGIISSFGVSSSLSSNTFLATQHRRSDLQRLGTSRIASQKQEILLATQTPGHVPTDRRKNFVNIHKFI